MINSNIDETENNDDYKCHFNCNETSELSSEWAEKAKQEINETPEIAKKSLSALRTLLTGQSDLHAKNDDAFLLRFLRVKKFNVSKAFSMLKKYYQMKSDNPELFQVARPSEKMHILKMQCQVILPKRANNGSRIYIFRVEKCDISRVKVEEVFCTNILALEFIVREPETQIAGLTAIIDMKGFKLQQHAKFLSPHYAKRTVDVVQETFPLRFKGFHVINQPYYFNTIFAVVKPFLKEKIHRRIYLHGKNYKLLHNFIEKEMLPMEYGGLEPFDNTQWRETILNMENYFVELEKYGYTNFTSSEKTQDGKAS